MARKARAMAIGAKLPADLRKEVVDAAVYPRNRAPRKPLGKKSTFEAFHGRKPSELYLRAFMYKAYAITKDVRRRIIGYREY